MQVCGAYMLHYLYLNTSNNNMTVSAVTKLISLLVYTNEHSVLSALNHTVRQIHFIENKCNTGDI